VGISALACGNAQFPAIALLLPAARKGPPVLAAVTGSPGELAIEDVSVPGPARAGNVIVRPEAVGICGSDFHLFSGDVGALSGSRDFYPRIQGHEVSAIVTDPGEGAAVDKGERVAIWPLLPCGGCYPCRSGRPNVCPRFRLVGVHLDGGVLPEKEIDVIGSSCATADDFQAAINLVRANRASLSALFSHHFPLTRAAEAFEFAMNRPPDAIKIVVTVN
jgi:threonine dehydrogenase-like Zn-dependent dehydrogenase